MLSGSHHLWSNTRIHGHRGKGRDRYFHVRFDPASGRLRGTAQQHANFGALGVSFRARLASTDKEWQNAMSALIYDPKQATGA
jgi:hypothetical protein